jgi:hypothetical protein
MEGPEVASAEVSDAELTANAPAVLDEQERLSVQSENGLPPSPAPLDRTVTLGQTETVEAAVGSERGAAEGGPIEPSPEPGTQSFSGTATGEPYYDTSYWGSSYWGGGYYWGPGRWGDGGDRGTRRSTSQGGVHIGQDWPSAPSYGPAFPFRSAPASPWAPAR